MNAKDSAASLNVGSPKGHDAEACLQRPSPVVTLDLARRLDEAETAVQISWSEGLARQEGNPLGISIRRFGDAAALAARNSEDPYLNRVMRVTSEHTPFLEEVVAWYRSQKIKCRVEIVPHLADEGLLRELARLGLAHTDFNTVFYAQPPFDPRPLPVGVAVRTYEFDEVETFAEQMVRIYPCLSDEEREGRRRDAISRQGSPGWRCYLAWFGGELAAWARMYTKNGAASFSGAGTSPHLRRNGTQTALLRQRILEARDMGCDLLVSQAAPGSTSQRNMEREGFRVAYNKAIWTDLK